MKLQALVVAAAAWVAVLVSPAHAVTVERVVSKAGITAWLVEDHANPIVTLHFAFHGGAALDPVGKEGLATMVASLLDEGSGKMDSEAFQGRLEDLSISLGFSADKDSFGGSVRTLTKNVDEAFRLVGQAMTQPRFDKEPIARIRSQILAGLSQEEEDPDTVAGRAITAKLFAGHPYARPTEGTEAGIKAITRADLKRFVAERLARDQLVIGVVGDVTPERLKGLLDSAFAGLPAHAMSISVPDTQPKADGSTTVIHMAVPQSAILLAQKGLLRNDPKFYDAYVLNYILGGGGFTSRLYQQVRLKRGLAYSVGSYLYPLNHAAMILVQSGTADARAAETVSVIRQQWKRMAEKGVTAEELKDAKKYLTGSFPLRFTSSSRIAGILVAMQLEHLGIDFLDKRNGLVNAVTLKGVNDMAHTLLTPDKLTAVVVGEPAGLKSSH